MHFYKFHIGDYETHTRHLTLLEDICYRRILDWLYKNEKPLPHEVKSVARLISFNERSTGVEIPLNELLEVVETVLNEFLTLTKNGWENKRVNVEIESFRTVKDTNSRAGKASAKKRAEAKALAMTSDSNERSTDVQQDFNECSTSVQPTINHKPLTINHKPIIKPPTPKGGGEGFEEFWKAYPKRVAKPQALKAWNAIKPDRELIDAILKGIEAHKKGSQWVKDGGQFIPHPTTWLKRRSWEDEIQPHTELSTFKKRDIPHHTEFAGGIVEVI